MKKYILFFIILFFCFFLEANALTYNEIKTRNVCNNFELARANNDKTLTNIKCYDNYYSAKESMNNTNDNNLIILERKNNMTRVIDAKEALVYLDNGETLTYYYRNSNLTGYITYMNHYANYGATDGVFLELNYDNHAIKVKTSGVVGWISDGSYKIVPLNFVGNSSYYDVSSVLTHYYAKNIQTTYSQAGRTIDSKPSFLNTGKYYSYDGIYFYNNLSVMINDYKNNTYNNSVNKDNPYYNYYMYLPHRARSNYSADDIDLYLKNAKGLIGSVYGKKVVSHYSNMWSTGIFFKSSETLYGSNAVLMLSLATNESALGQSSIAINKNNLFGHAAYDSNAYDSATGYLNAYQSIIGHAKSYINCGYANPNDSRYYGSNMGNKASGMNIMYASDPYWGEKAANYYYMFDRDNGLLDYNYYQLGITTHDSLNVRVEPNLTSGIPYNLKYQNVPVIILDEVEGAYVNGSNKWYKIVSDANLTDNRNSIQSCSYTNYYNYNSYVYVHSSFIRKINQASKYNGISNNNDVNIIYTEYSSGANYNPKVLLVSKDSKVYNTATKTIENGKVVKSLNLVPVFMEAKIDSKTTAYLVEIDYSKNQKGWISSENATVQSKDLLKVNLNNAGDYLNVYNNLGGNVIGSMYDATYAVILDSKIYNNDLWVQIYYGIDNTTAWINTNISSDKGSIQYTLDNLNHAPTIQATNLNIIINSSFDALVGVTAFDSEDGDLTSSIVVTKNNVDTSKAGNYEVTYEVSDKSGLKTVKTIQITIYDYKEGEPLFLYESLSQVNNTTFEFKGFLGIKKMDNIDVTHYLKFVNNETNLSYQIKLDDYSNYPYEMSSLDDDKPYNYSGGWFQGKIDLNKDFLKQGDYTIYILAYNNLGYKTETYFTNIAFLDMPRRIKTKTRGIAFDIDYSMSGSPMILTIRDQGLLSYTEPTSFDPTYNFFNEIILENNNLNLMGTSHSYGINYGKEDDVKREIVFENTSTFDRYTYNLGYIDDGPYKVELAVSDGKDKTRAWYKNNIDLSKLKTGNYAIYLKTTSNDDTYYGELIDIAYTDFSNINNSKYEFKRIDEKRLRIELNVK